MNRGAVHLLKANTDKIVWRSICYNHNPKAVDLLKNNMDKGLKELSPQKVEAIEIICYCFFGPNGYSKSNLFSTGVFKLPKILFFRILSIGFRLLYPLRLKLLR